MRNELRRHTAEELAQLSDAICQSLSADDVLSHADVVLAFWPMSSEPDVRPLIRAWYAEGKTVLLPRVTGATTMEFCRYQGDDSLHPMPPYGILEPTGDAVDADAIMQQGRVVMLVPGVAFDASCHRLGHGCGYYDRYLHDHPVTTIGVCFPFQLVDNVPVDEYDIPVSRCR